MRTKKFLCLTIAAITVCGGVIFSRPACKAGAETAPAVVLDGVQLTFDVPPQIINDRVMLPFRAIAEAMGAGVYWDADSQKIIMYSSDKYIEMVVGNPVMKYGDYRNDDSGQTIYDTVNEYKMDSPPVIVNERTLIPLRAISEALEAQVEWDGSTMTVTIVSSPTYKTVFPLSVGIDQNGFWKGIRALDYIEMFNYKAMLIPKDVYTIPDAVIQTKINDILSKFSYDAQTTDRAVASGDIVNINYHDIFDGVKHTGGDIDGGMNMFVGGTDSALDSLIGHIPGETVNVEITYPDDYEEVSDRGKTVLFVIVINYIRERKNPELTDDFVAEKLSSSYGWTTVEEMKEGIHHDIQRSNITEYIQQHLTEATTVRSVPDQLFEHLENSMMYTYQLNARFSEKTLEEYISANDGVESVDELKAVKYDEIMETARYDLIVQAVAEDAGISVSQADTADYFAEQTSIDAYSAYEKFFGAPFMKQAVLYKKVINYIADNAVLS
ncbi:MAG: stalk domain-containing protein [Firmicutes bacterium]|nr:stalk domain-containing protein [Bacillota bacterium]